MKKSLYDISWKVNEDEYRADKALSYSTLAKYEREGFEKLSTLFDPVSSPSLTLGSAVDSIITGGEAEFNERFLVAEFPDIPDSIIQIIKVLFEEYKETNEDLTRISNDSIIEVARRFNYQNNWKPETRAKVIKEKGSEYYKLLYISEDKTIISSDTYKDVINMVDALKDSEATSYYFAPNNPFENVERFYQLKFKSTFENIDYRCMADLIIVDYDKKEITPCDLKTSFKPEYNFFKSFLDWSYHIQARLYWRIIRENMDKDEYFKDFKLSDYKFIVVNKKTLCPLVWDYHHTSFVGELHYGTHSDITIRDPFNIGYELNYYLKHNPKVPFRINTTKSNDIVRFLNTL